jgi:NAD(P)-dependent dehydrogenase (short-subunit alcohol dehydrogenase family)
MIHTTMEGKICLIIGGTNGIGKSTAQVLAKLGSTVVINILVTYLPVLNQIIEEIATADTRSEPV